MPETTTITSPLPSTELEALAIEFEQPVQDIQASLAGILAEDIILSFPADQQLQIAIGVLRSRAMEGLLDGGRTFHVHVISAFDPKKITPKEGEPFTLATVLGVGYIKNEDGSDGPTGIVEVGLFTRKDTPKSQLDLQKRFEPGKTYEVSLGFKGKVPEPGQRLYYGTSSVNSTNPKEIPTTAKIDGPAFLKTVFPTIRVEDVPKHATSDADDFNTWVSVDAAVITARRGIGKAKKRPYGFYEVTNVGTKVSDLKKNPNAKATMRGDPPMVKWTVGSRLVFFGPIMPPSDDGEYSASMRVRAIAPIIGIPYIQAVEANGAARAAPSASKSAATEDAADVTDFN